MIVRSFTSTALVLLAVAVPAAAQSFNGAVFLSVGAGLVAHDNGAFSRRLKSYTPARESDGGDLLYQTRDFQGTGTTLNGGIGVMFAGGIVADAGGESLHFPDMRPTTAPGEPRDVYRLSAMGGGLDLGYAVVNDHGMMIYPFLHGGYYQYSLDYENNQSQAMTFFEGKPVPAHTTATYTGGAPRWALGFGLRKLLGADGSTSQGGLMLGVRLSWGMMTSRPEWLEPDGSVVKNGGLTPGYNGVSLAISLGGGFGWK